MVKNLLPQHVVPNGKYKLIVYLRVSLGSGQSPSWFDDFKIVHKPASGPDRIYTADVKSYSDYYAFGMQMPGRYANDGYRYGFNGHEKDDEIKGEGNSYDFGARIYDPRLGRWLAVDPAAHLYVPISPYAFTINNPIKLVDIDGEKIYDGDKEVIVIINEKTGTASYTYQDGSAVSENFMRNGAVVIDAMIKVKSGQEAVTRMIDMPTEIKIVYDKNTPSYKSPGYGLTEGKRNVVGEDGKKYYKTATVTIYEQNLADEETRIFQNGGDLINKEEGIGMAGTHETIHLDPDQRKIEKSLRFSSEFGGESFWLREEGGLKLEYDYRSEYREKHGTGSSEKWKDWYKSETDSKGNPKPKMDGTKKQ